jgi:adenosylmethionine-8-amino-7-oxononanoate aminotransferase
VINARSLGTILAIEIKSSGATAYDNEIRSKIYPFFLERNILLRPLGNVIYVVPPYIVTKEELTTIHNAIEEFLDSLK